MHLDNHQYFGFKPFAPVKGISWYVSDYVKFKRDASPDFEVMLKGTLSHENLEHMGRVF
jgi:hypothetical protein